MRTYPRLAAIALIAGVVTPRLGNERGGGRLAGEGEGDYSEPVECPNDEGVFLIQTDDGWYCEECGEIFDEPELW